MAKKNKYKGRNENVADVSSSCSGHSGGKGGAECGKSSFVNGLPWVWFLAFILFWAFCSVVYGPVFRRAAEANFVTTDATSMKFLTDQPWGWLLWAARWGLLVFKSMTLGGFLLAAVLTLTACLADRLFGVSRKWRGVSALLPAAVLGWMLWRGTNIYYKSEPSLIILVPVLMLLAVSIALALKAFVPVRRVSVAPPNRKVCRTVPYGTFVVVALFVTLVFSAKHYNENEILTARMQMRAMSADWEGIIEDATSARRPTRAVAAYYAVALLQEGQLLERLFDIPYDYPKVRLEHKDGNEEYGLFLADCNFYAGLINPAYRSGMDCVVMQGPDLYDLKRMALCAILNGEQNLAQKYFAIIGRVPFESTFVEKYQPMVTDSTLIESDEVLRRVKSLVPWENHFEQYYRSPAFLGYNVGLATGSDASLETAIAACLYSKELPHAMDYVGVYAQKNGGRLPLCVQQAITLVAGKIPAVAQAFPNVVTNNQATLSAFLSAARPFIEERNRLSAGKSRAEQERIKVESNAKIRAAMREDWLGSYYYYYYCENNDPSQVVSAKHSGVN